MPLNKKKFSHQTQRVNLNGLVVYYEMIGAESTCFGAIRHLLQDYQIPN